MGRVNEVVHVDQSMVIGFAPPVSKAALEEDPGLSSALEHWEMGLDNTAACLKSSGVQVRAVYADTVTMVLSEERNVALEVHPSRDPHGIGAYLVAPGQAARLLYLGDLGVPSAWVHSLPGVAADTFHVAECCSESNGAMGFCSQR
jgi:hypothetical protein